MRDDELIQVDELAKKLCREMGYTGTEFGLEVVSTINAVLSRAKQGDFTLYRESRPYPFALDGLEEVHGALRLSSNDAALVRDWVMGKPGNGQAPAGAVGASGGMEPDKAGPAPLTTGNIAFCFAGLRWDEQKWKKPLGDKPKWLRVCIAIPGVRGVSETRWNPVFIGAALIREGHAKPHSVRAKFQAVHILQPWLETWKTYEADNFDT